MINTTKKMKQLFVATVTTTLLFGCGGSAETKTDLTKVDPSQPVDSWVMVWNDEFDGTQLDSGNWTFEVNCAGGGNNEKQCYTDSSDNAFVSDGVLNIVARPAEAGADAPYTSARINSRYKADFKYGRFEIRAKLPSGQGSWPAFWMMPTDEVYGGWPRSGEIDIFEAVNLKAADADGNPESHIYGTLHYGRAWPNNASSGAAYKLPDGSNPADDFHTYAIEWQEGEIRWYLDGYLYATQRQSEVKYNRDGEATGLKHKGWFAEYFNQGTGELETHWDAAPFDQHFYMILNLAVGGDWPENVNELGIDADAFAQGQTLAVDWIRVYECATDPDTGRGCETIRPGYDSLDDALVEGEAPVPAAPSSGEPDPVTIIYDDALAAGLSFDSYNPDSLVTFAEVEEAGRGQVIEIVKTGATGNVYVVAEQPFDLSAYGDIGELVFDIRIDSAGADSELLVKFDSGWPNVSDIPVSVPADGMWREVRINIAELLARGNTYSEGNFADPASVTNIFVAEPTGEMTFRLDNIRLEYPTTTQVTTFYDDALASDLSFDSFNPDSQISFAEVAEEGRGNIISVIKTGPTGNMYFTADAPYDLTQYGEYGELVFDLNVASLDAGVELLVKFDSGWPNVSDMAVTLPETGTWATIRINIDELLAQENRYSPGSSAIADSVVNVFVVEPTGAMEFKLDNIRLEKPPAPQTSMLYDDLLAEGLIFNSYNPDSLVSYEEIAEEGRGSVLEVTKTGATGNVYFQADVPYDVSDWGPQSELVFDVNVTSLDAGSELLVKLDSGWPNVSDWTVSLPETGEWAEVRINLADMLANGNTYAPGSFADPSSIVNIFVIEPTGAMTVKFDNVRLIKR